MEKQNGSSLSSLGVLFEQNSCFNHFQFFGISFPWKYRLPLKTHSTKLRSFCNNWCNFHIDKIKERLVKRQLKMLGMVQKKLYRTTLKSILYHLILE